MKGLRWQTKVVSILAIGAIVDICSGVMTFMLLRAGFIDESFLTDMVTLEMINYACLIFIPTAILALRMLVQDLKSAHKLTSERMKAINRSGLVAVLNTDGIILDINENLAEFLEYSADEVRGNHHHMLCSEEYATSIEYQQFWKMLAAGKFITGTFERLSKYRESKWLMGSYNPIMDTHGNVVEILKIASDATEEVLNRREIMHKNIYLEHAAKILRHDMHSGINTYIPRGLKSLKRRVTTDQIEQLRISAPIRLIEEGLAHAQKVYKGVFEFTNLVKPDTQLTTEIVNAGDALSEYLSNTAYKDQVAIDRLPMLKINEPLFCTAIDNLIRNGLKYNDSEFRMVAISMIDEFHLGVLDNGRGMTQSEFEDYCRPYLRKDEQKESGTGLGLNISVAILTEHSFTITAQKQKQGTLLRIKVR